MNLEFFNKVVEEQLQICSDVLIKKGEEYATEDRLHNFKVAAGIQGTSARKALGGMMAKHTVSIYDMIASGEQLDYDLWEEKITDHINYLLLLKAMVAEDEKANSSIFTTFFDKIKQANEDIQKSDKGVKPMFLGEDKRFA